MKNSGSAAPLGGSQREFPTTSDGVDLAPGDNSANQQEAESVQRRQMVDVFKRVSFKSSENFSREPAGTDDGEEEDMDDLEPQVDPRLWSYQMENRRTDDENSEGDDFDPYDAEAEFFGSDDEEEKEERVISLPKGLKENFACLYEAVATSCTQAKAVLKESENACASTTPTLWSTSAAVRAGVVQKRTPEQKEKYVTVLAYVDSLRALPTEFYYARAQKKCSLYGAVTASRILFEEVYKQVHGYDHEEVKSVLRPHKFSDEATESFGASMIGSAAAWKDVSTAVKTLLRWSVQDAIGEEDTFPIARKNLATWAKSVETIVGLEINALFLNSMDYQDTIEKRQASTVQSGGVEKRLFEVTVRHPIRPIMDARVRLCTASERAVIKTCNQSLEKIGKYLCRPNKEYPNLVEAARELGGCTTNLYEALRPVNTVFRERATAVRQLAESYARQRVAVARSKKDQEKHPSNHEWNRAVESFHQGRPKETLESAFKNALGQLLATRVDVLPTEATFPAQSWTSLWILRALGEKRAVEENDHATPACGWELRCKPKKARARARVGQRSVSRSRGTIVWE